MSPVAFLNPEVPSDGVKKGSRFPKFFPPKIGCASNGTPSMNKMYYVYIIQSVLFQKQIYTGFSENIDERLDEHNCGKSVHTNKFKPWKLICYVSFCDKQKALDLERYLKTASGIAFRNKRLI